MGNAVPPTKRSKNAKQSANRAFRPPFRERVAGSARGGASRIGEAVHKRHRELVGRTKHRRKEVKTIDQIRPNAGNSQRKERAQNNRTAQSHVRASNCPRPIAEQRSVFGGRSAAPRRKRISSVGRLACLAKDRTLNYRPQINKNCQA